MEPDLKNKLVVITGANGRLGKVLTHGFAMQGARIAAIVRNEQQAKEIPFPKEAEGWAFTSDVTNERMVRNVFRQISEKFGPISVFIHSVGIWDSARLTEMTTESWDLLYNVNLKSAFYCVREVIPLLQHGYGRIICFASMPGADRSRAGVSAYAASKAGIIKLIESAAEELGDVGRTAHVIAPSNILFGTNTSSAGVSAKKIVEACLFLCTDSASSTNGTVLRMYGS